MLASAGKAALAKLRECSASDPQCLELEAKVFSPSFFLFSSRINWAGDERYLCVPLVIIGRG